MRSAILRLALGAALVGTALTGCADNKNDIAKGRRYAQQGNYGAAHEAFDKALAADANDYNALWGKADTYRREGNLAKQAEILEKVTASEELMKAYAGVVKPALEENYRKQAEQKMADAAAAEGFLRKAIALNKKSEANVTLANLLYKQGKEAFGKKAHGKALKFYGDALKLRMPRKLRRKIKMQHKIAEMLKFEQDFEPQWQAVKPKLIEAGQYDEKTDTIFVTAVVEVDGKPKDEGYEKAAETKALAAVTQGLYDLTWMVAGKGPRPEGASVAYSAKAVQVVEKGFTKDKRPRKYGFRVSLARGEVIEKAGLVQKGEFKKPAPAAPAAPGSGAAPGSAAGSAPASAPASK